MDKSALLAKLNSGASSNALAPHDAGVKLKIRKRSTNSDKPKAPSAPRQPKPTKAPAAGVKKIRLYPTAEQESTLKRWLGTARWTYNRALDAVKHGCSLKKRELRELCVNNELWETQNGWVAQTPYDVRDEAMNDVIKAYKSSFALHKDSGTSFEVRYRSRKKSRQESIVMHAKHWKCAGVFHPAYWGKQALKASEPLPDKLAYDSRLVRDVRLNRYYLCVPHSLVVQSESQAPRDETVVALDPGVRAFQTTYSPDGRSLSIGEKDMTRISRLCVELDKLQSRCSGSAVRHRQRYRMKRAAARIRQKIRDLIKDVHHKTAKLLCQNYTTILIPLFETRHMTSRLKRRIGSKTARMMLTWSHYRFREILESKAAEYPWCRVFVVNEAYTSKTCGACGRLNAKLGSSKRFKCPHAVCGVEMDRDVNGARNILLRFMTCDKRAQVIRELAARSALGPTPSAFRAPATVAVQS